MNGTVVIFGANGFLGRYLTRHFLRQGREVVAVARGHFKVEPDAMFLEWDGHSLGPWALALEGAAMVINLAGRSVDCRYTAANRREILGSRVDSTRVIGEAIKACKVPPKVWMNASTATWYRHAEDAPQGEWSGEPGEGFSCDVARIWEEAFFGAGGPGATRKIALRIGMVLANEPGSVYAVVRRLARWGLGGAMAGGRQRVSWIHMQDFLGAIKWLEDQPLVDGVINLTAPDSPTNAEWLRAFRETVAMPLGLPASRWMLELGARFLGTEAELVTKSRWAAPERLADLGFNWRWPSISPALVDLESREGLDEFFSVPSRRAVGARAWTGGVSVGAS
jgi:hypothetical protein